MAYPHTKDQARDAKNRLVDRLKKEVGITSVGIGLTEKRDDYAVTVTVLNENHRRKIPTQVDGVPVQVYVSGPISRY